jgi:two-component system chemotaxis sensor kinase CheA
MNALLAQFIPEARDLLEQAGTGMLALERDAASPSVINDVFRAVHTLKGSSGLFDVAPLTLLVHAAEDLLGEVRTGELELNSDIVDRLLDSLDVVGRWIDALEVREELPSNAEATMKERVVVLRSWLARRDSLPPHAGRADPATPAGTAQAPDWIVKLPEADRMAAYRAVSGRRLLAWTFVPEEGCFFRGDDPVAMLRHAPGVLSLRVLPREPLPSFEALDPLVSFLRFEVLSDTSRETLEEHMRYVVDCIEVSEIEPRELVIASGSPAGGPIFGDFGRLARQQAKAADRAGLARSIASLLTMIAPSSFQASALRWCQVHLECFGFDQPDGLERLIGAVETGAMPAFVASHKGTARPAGITSPSARSQASTDRDPRALAHRIATEQIRVLETPADPAIEPGRRRSVALVLKNLALSLADDAAGPSLDTALAVLEASGDLAALRGWVAGLAASKGDVSPDGDMAPAERAATAAQPVAPEASRAAEPAQDNKSIPRVLRVDQAKIDSIMTLVAELIVAKNGLSYLATRAEQVHGSRTMAREIKDQFAVIDRITQGLQVGVMSVRMMPVSQVFQRFPRLIRDISRKLGKKIELVIEGEDTEADKNVLESLADPLIHMVRNSLDHGIETPAERRACGKPEQGTLKITARQENDFVVIQVRDDGKGIDPRRVREKAAQLGIVSSERAEQMGDAEAVNLVFAAGFSTKEKVSDLSGRGVGMDVVRSAVLKAGGDVSLQSTLGVGTTVTVRLPLTMAVTRIVTIQCCGRIFGIPMDLIAETVRIRRDQIHRIKDLETFVLRDAIIPIVRLARSLRLVEKDARRDEEAVMVVRAGRGRVGVVVDGFRERLEVIVKPLEGVLEGMPGFSGTALLGDGNVLLILDLLEML